MKKRTFASLILSFMFYANAMTCTIFVFTQQGKTYFCNNEDYSNPDTEIHFNPSENGKYAWVYLGFSNNWAQGGVNEKGLCWDWVSRGGDYEYSWKVDNTKITMMGNPCEKMITECATVDDAIKFYEKYNDRSLKESRIMLGDKSGNSAIIEWKDGKIHIIRNSSNLQAFGYGGYSVESYFSNNSGEKNIAYFAEALNVAHQEGQYPTLYSNIISLSDGKIYLYKDHNYSEYIEIDYLAKLKGGYTKYKIIDLFKDNMYYSECLLKKQDSISRK